MGKNWPNPLFSEEWLSKVIGISRWRWVYLAWKTGEIMTLSDWYIMYVYAVGQDGVWREIHFALSQASRDGFASMQAFSFSYKLMLSCDNLNFLRLLVFWRGQWGNRGWARRLEREQEAALKKRLVWLIKKKFCDKRSIFVIGVHKLAESSPFSHLFYFVQERGPAQQTIKSYFSKVSLMWLG